MKKSIFMLIAVVAMVMLGCNEKSAIPNPGDITLVPDSMPQLKYPDPTPDPEGADVPDSCITVYEARKIAQQLHGATSTKKYYIKGWISRLDEKNADGITSYGNATFYMTATNDGATDKYSFEAYQAYGKDGRKFTAVEQVAVGDFVVLYGQIMKYGDQPETPGKGAAYVYSSTNEAFNEAFPPVTPPDTIHATCAEAKTAALALPSGGTSNDIYVVEGYVQSAGYSNEISSGQQKFFWMDDKVQGNKVLEAFYCNVPNGQPVPVGSKVRLTGKLMNYNGTVAEIKNGDVVILEEAGE